MAIQIVVGLGNPGAGYDTTRHNVGFWIVDRLAREQGSGEWLECGNRLESSARIAGTEIRLVKPMTFMNRSGAAVATLMAGEPVEPDEFLICYDDLALPLGRIRIRVGGSHGGHNGMRSIIERLGTTEFPRLRVGIEPDDREVEDASDFVLTPFAKCERPTIEHATAVAADAVKCAVEHDLLTAMNRYNPEPL